MTASERRKAVLAEIRSSEKPLSAASLAQKFGVSRQAVVGDIALLRASGNEIISTARGYLINQAEGILATIVCIHTMENMELELNAIVDNGCTVLDVCVEHPVYGEITGGLDLSSRYDVAEFIAKLESENAPPLSSLTGGVHVHNLSCPNEEALKRVCIKLKEHGILFDTEK